MNETLKIEWTPDYPDTVAVSVEDRRRWIAEIITKNPEGSYITSGDSLVIVWPDGSGGFYVYDCLVRRDGWVAP